MRSSAYAVVFVLAACSSAPSPTTTAPPAPVAKVAAAPAAKTAASPPAGPTQVADDGKLICKRITVTGSNYPKKFCSTQAEWDAQAKASLEQSERIEASRNAADASTVGRAR